MRVRVLQFPDRLRKRVLQLPDRRRKTSKAAAVSFTVPHSLDWCWQECRAFSSMSAAAVTDAILLNCSLAAQFLTAFVTRSRAPVAGVRSRKMHDTRGRPRPTDWSQTQRAEWMRCSYACGSSQGSMRSQRVSVRCVFTLSRVCSPCDQHRLCK